MSEDRDRGSWKSNESEGEKYIRGVRLKAEAFATLELARLPCPANYLSSASHLRSVSRDLEKWLRLGGRLEDFSALFDDNGKSLEAREAHLSVMTNRIKSMNL